MCRVSGHGYLIAGNKYRGNGLIQFFVNRRPEVREIITFFRQYPLRSKKRRDFEIWAEAFEAYDDALAAGPLYARTRSGNERWPSMRGNGRRHTTPLVGTKRKQFRVIPDGLFSEMQGYAERLRNGRKYEPLVATSV